MNFLPYSHFWNEKHSMSHVTWQSDDSRHRFNNCFIYKSPPTLACPIIPGITNGLWNSIFTRSSAWKPGERRDMQTVWKWHLKVHVYSVLLCKHSGLWARPVQLPPSCMTMGKSLLLPHFLIVYHLDSLPHTPLIACKNISKIPCTWSLLLEYCYCIVIYYKASSF